MERCNGHSTLEIHETGRDRIAPIKTRSGSKLKGSPRRSVTSVTRPDGTAEDHGSGGRIDRNRDSQEYHDRSGLRAMDCYPEVQSKGNTCNRLRTVRSIEDCVREDRHFTGNRVAESVLASAPLWETVPVCAIFFKGWQARPASPEPCAKNPTTVHQDCLDA